MLHTLSRHPARAALLIAAVAAATLAGAWTFEYLGYVPCKLCLQERWPYYAAVPIGLLAFVFRNMSPVLTRLCLLLLALVFAAGAVLGGYHAGAEWHFWPGPSDCGGGSGAGPAQVGDFLKNLNQTKVVSCDEAALRILGLSLAGWNTLISLGLAMLALVAAIRTSQP